MGNDIGGFVSTLGRETMRALGVLMIVLWIVEFGIIVHGFATGANPWPIP